MGDAPLPDVRASDADRERVVERLRQATADGQLTPDELEDRLNTTYAARFRRELMPLTADLQATGHEDLPSVQRNGMIEVSQARVTHGRVVQGCAIREFVAEAFPSEHTLEVGECFVSSNRPRETRPIPMLFRATASRR